jgi:hypothetical protein
MHETIGPFMRALHGWETVAELTFAVFAERGIIDLVAWHAATRSLLIIELKTALVDPQELVAVMDRRIRLASQIVAKLGWRPTSVSAWVIVAESRTNRRRVAAAQNLLRGRFPSDGRAMRAWLRAPVGEIRALSFWTVVAGADRMRLPVTPRRVRPTRAEAAERAAARGSVADPA